MNHQFHMPSHKTTPASTAASTTLEIPQCQGKSPWLTQRVFRQAPSISGTASDEETQVRDDTDRIEGTLSQADLETSTLLMPVPGSHALLRRGRSRFRPNIITVAWAGIVCSDPAMISVSIRKERHSYGIISATKIHRQHTICFTGKNHRLVRNEIRSGRGQVRGNQAHPLPATQVKCPLIADCPINIECKVARVVPLGSHDLFIAKNPRRQHLADLLDKRGKLSIEQADLLIRAFEYRTLGKRSGHSDSQ